MSLAFLVIPRPISFLARNYTLLIVVRARYRAAARINER